MPMEPFAGGQTHRMAALEDGPLFTELASFAAAHPNLRVRFIRGGQCDRKASLLDEVAAALQFAPSFGRNWDALADALTDAIADSGEGLALVILAAESLLKGDSAEQRQHFAEVLAAAAEFAGQGSKARPGQRKFRVIWGVGLKTDAGFVKRWESAGVSFERS
jgi:RNAse (barnase) inhibitor barstar